MSHSINMQGIINGIRSCVFLPGEVATPILDRRPNPVGPEERVRMVQPQDCADLILYIALLPRAADHERSDAEPNLEQHLRRGNPAALQPLTPNHPRTETDERPVPPNRRKKLLLPTMSKAGWALVKRAERSGASVRTHRRSTPVVGGRRRGRARRAAVQRSDSTPLSDSKSSRASALATTPCDVPALTRRKIPLMIGGTANWVTVAEAGSLRSRRWPAAARRWTRWSGRPLA